MTKRLWQLHSWIGLICGAGLLLIGITGTLLVFHDEIETVIHPRMMAVTPTSAGRLPLDRLIGAVQRSFPDYEISYWILRREPQWTDVLYLVRHGERETRFVTIDQYRGEVRAPPTDTNATFTGWMLNLHYTFFAGKTGVTIAGILAILLCFLGLSGFWIYRGFWKHFFRLRWDRSARIFFSDFHKMIGITSVILNLILGSTGAYFNIMEMVRYFQYGAEVAPKSTGRFYSNDLSLDSLLLQAKEKLPGFDASYLALPMAPGGPIIFAGRLSGQNTIRSDYGSSVSFDAKTGAFQQAADIRKATPLAQLIDTIVPLHFGTFGGIAIKILWCFAGLAPGLLAISGFFIWRSRRNTRRTSLHQRSPLDVAAAVPGGNRY